MRKNKKVVKEHTLTFIWCMLIAIVSFGMIYYFAAGYSMPSAMTYGGDGLLGEGLVKSIQENGLKGALISYRIGAPENSVLLDTPFLDWINIIEIYIVSFIADSPSVINQVVYWISYPLATLLMYGLLRMLMCSREISTAIAFVFAFSPYHFYRNTGHGTLSNYFMIPVAIAVGIFIVYDGEIKKPFKTKKHNQVLFLILSFLLGFTNIYYTAFGLIFITWAVIYVGISGKSFKKLTKNLLYPGMTIMGVAVALLPKFVYCLIHGQNQSAGVRSFIESEIFGLKIIQMLLPSLNSRVGNISEITRKYMSDNPYINENQFASLGIVASIGFIIACLYLVVAMVKHDKNKEKDFLSVALLILVLFCTVGGFGALFNFFIIPEIRCYNRASIFISCIALVFLALYLSKINKRIIQMLALICILIVAFFDQITIDQASKWDGAKASAVMSEAFYGEVENSVPENAMIYQIPFMAFPENGAINDMQDYEQMSAYVFTDTIRWSYGGMKGRNIRAQELYIDDGMSDSFLSRIKAEGFVGVCIDLNGYPEEKRQDILLFYDNHIEKEPIISQDGNLYYYDIRS